MARKSAEMKKLSELRERKLAEIQDLQRRIETAKTVLSGIDQAILAVGGTIPTGEVADATKARGRNVKRTVMEIVQQAGPLGVTAAEVVEKAGAQGKTLAAKSVSSLLSRFKAEKVLTFDGERYRPVDGRDPGPNGANLKVVKTA